MMKVDQTTQEAQDSTLSNPQSEQVSQEFLATPRPETKKNKLIILLSLLFLTTLILFGILVFQKNRPKRPTTQAQPTSKPTSEAISLPPTQAPFESIETTEIVEENKIYSELSYWYTIEVKQKTGAPTPPYYSYAYIRKPIADVLSLQDHELIEEIVADTSKTRLGIVNFNGDYYIFVSKVSIPEKLYEDNSLFVDVKKLFKQDLVPYLVDNNYCEQNSDCTVRNAYYCAYGAFNYFESLKDHVSGCAGVTFDDEIQESVDTMCHELIYQNPICKNNSCTATQRVYEPIACD